MEQAVTAGITALNLGSFSGFIESVSPGIAHSKL